MARRIAMTLTAFALALTTAGLARGQSSGGDEPKPLGSAAIDLDALSDWGTRTYKYMLIEPDGAVERVGEVTMTTNVGSMTVTFRDAWSIESGGRTLGWRMKADCDKVGMMRPMRIVTSGSEADELALYRLQTIGNRAVITPIDGAQRTIDLPRDTATDAALYRIVGLLPRKADRQWRVGHLWELSELNLKRGGVITCTGRDTISLAGEDVTLWRYTYGHGDRIAAEFWVDADSPHLRQFKLDGRKAFVETDAPEE